MLILSQEENTAFIINNSLNVASNAVIESRPPSGHLP